MRPKAVGEPKPRTLGPEPPTDMNIVLIGAGNTATVLGKKLKQARHQILQVYGRNEKQVQRLANELDAPFATRPDTLTQNADLYLIAVSDNAVEEVARLLPLTGQRVAHTAASVSLNVLKGKASEYGVFYPLQSMRKELPTPPDFTVLVDAGDAGTLQRLQGLAATVAGRVIVADDDARLKMHLAAVMVNNFTNHLLALVEDYCSDERLDFHSLLPLIKETVLRLDEISPFNAQTGPAARHDSTTIAKHLSLLEKKPELKKIYTLFTQSIQESRQ